jgi:predicted nucleotidyltransferase
MGEDRGENPDQLIVDDFLRDFAEKLSTEYDIDFILLFGSAARGEWRRGISDVDMIIQIVRQEDKEDVRKAAEEIFWELDKRHQTEFRKVCSISAEEDEPLLERAIKKGQSTARLYAPFEVLGPEDVDWERGELKGSLLRLGADLVAPKFLLFIKMKTEGKVIYGRDITRVINPQVSWFDRVKAILVPHHLSFFSFLVSLFLPKMAARMATKAAIYSVESCLCYLKKPIGKGIDTAMADLEREIGHNKWINIQHIKDVYELKYSGRLKDKFSRVQALTLSLKTFILVVKLNWWAVLHRLKDKLPRI